MKKSILPAIMALAVSACASATPTTKTDDGYYLFKYGRGTVVLDKAPDPWAYDAWKVQCPIDGMTDRRDCSVLPASMRVLVYYGASTAAQSVCVVGHDVPGRTAQLRVDQNAPISTDEDGCVPAGRILGQMTRGNALLVHYAAMAPRPKWAAANPANFSVQDDIISLDGLNKAIAIMAEIQQGKLAALP